MYPHGSRLGGQPKKDRGPNTVVYRGWLVNVWQSKSDLCNCNGSDRRLLSYLGNIKYTRGAPKKPNQTRGFLVSMELPTAKKWNLLPYLGGTYDTN